MIWDLTGPMPGAPGQGGLAQQDRVADHPQTSPTAQGQPGQSLCWLTGRAAVDTAPTPPLGEHGDLRRCGDQREHPCAQRGPEPSTWAWPHSSHLLRDHQTWKLVLCSPWCGQAAGQEPARPGVQPGLWGQKGEASRQKNGGFPVSQNHSARASQPIMIDRPNFRTLPWQQSPRRPALQAAVPSPRLQALRQPWAAPLTTGPTWDTQDQCTRGSATALGGAGHRDHLSPQQAGPHQSRGGSGHSLSSGWAS